MAISKQQPLRPYVQELGDAVDTIADKIDDGEIISAGAVEAFGTVAQMQAATYLTDGMVCHTNGFHTEGDGGAAYYTIGTTGTANDMDVLSLQGGLFATLVVTEPYVTPEMFGAYGNGTSDDANSLKRTIDYATAQGAKVEFSFGKTYLVSVGITIGAVDVCMNSPILYTGNDTAVTIGERTSSIARYRYKVWITSNSTPYVAGSVGLQVYNAINCIFDIHSIAGFERGAVFSGYNRGFGYNSVSVNYVANCMYAIMLRSDGTSGWCNENYFYNGRLFVQSGLSYTHSFIGITIDSEWGYLANANTFENMSIEGAGICIHIVYGMYNKFNRIRSEGATLVFKDEHSSNWNYVNVSYGTTAYDSLGAMDVVDGSLLNYQALSMPVFDSGFLPSKSFSNDTFLFAGKDVCYMTSNGVSQVYKGVKYNDHLNIQSRNMGVMLDTSIAKKFNITVMPYNNAPWSVIVVCYDENDNYINTGLKYNSNRSFYVSNGGMISGVTCWVTGSAAIGNTFFELPSNCVKAFVGIAGVSDMCGFRILSDLPYVKVIGNQVANGLAEIPTCEGKAGDFCPSSAADNVLGWLYNGTEWVAIS